MVQMSALDQDNADNMQQQTVELTNHEVKIAMVGKENCELQYKEM